jgi:hypothetical protein
MGSLRVGALMMTWWFYCSALLTEDTRCRLDLKSLSSNPSGCIQVQLYDEFVSVPDSSDAQSRLVFRYARLIVGVTFFTQIFLSPTHEDRS